MKHIFIINPTSGKGNAIRFTQGIERVCNEENLEYKIYYTKVSGEATIIAEKYKEEENIIYSVGGDGTLSEVVNGIVGSKNMLGIIPAGSGNDFYKTIKNKKEEKMLIDIGKINDRYFLNIACAGIDAEVANNAAIMKKTKIPASQIYNISILYTFIKYKFPNIKLYLNGTEREGRYTILSICNGRYYGGGYEIAPHAEINDGLFDIYYMDHVPKFKIPSLLLKVIKGTHETSKYIHKEQASSAEIITKEPIGFNVDGETIQGTEFHIEIIKNAITMYNNLELTNKFMNQNKMDVGKNEHEGAFNYDSASNMENKNIFL